MSDTEIRDIFKRDDGGPVRPPEEIETLFAEIKTAVDKYIATRGPAENCPDSVTDYGACPECHENHGYRFHGNQIYFICQTHRLAWCAGSGFFSAWQHMTPEALTAQELELQWGYTITEPWLPPRIGPFSPSTFEDVPF